MTVGDERRSGEDRRESEKPSAWQDPRTWMTLCGLLLAFLGYVSSQLHDINSGIQALNVASATQKEQISNLAARVTAAELKTENNSSAIRDYNYNLTTRLAKVEAKQDVQQKEK